MVDAGLTTAIKQRPPDAKGLGRRVEQELRDIVQQAEHAKEIVSTEMPVWYYWVPQPGVRCYCYEPVPAPEEILG
jgi:hypothetical protein